MQKPKPISIYNIADDEPTGSPEVDEYAAKLMNISAPSSSRNSVVGTRNLIFEYCATFLTPELLNLHIMSK